MAQLQTNNSTTKEKFYAPRQRDAWLRLHRYSSPSGMLTSALQFADSQAQSLGLKNLPVPLEQFWYDFEYQRHPFSLNAFSKSIHWPFSHDHMRSIGVIFILTVREPAFMSIVKVSKLFGSIGFIPISCGVTGPQ